jgi:hypothetical protein
MFIVVAIKKIIKLIKQNKSKASLGEIHSHEEASLGEMHLLLSM